MTNYYDILGVSQDATQDQIKSAYRTLASKHHPDKNPDNKEESEKKFKEINEAYSCLKSEDDRANYDYSLKHPHNDFQGFTNGFSNSTEDIFNSIFMNFGHGGGSPFGFHPRKPKNSDVHINLSITLEEAFSGTEKIIQYKELNDTKTLNITIPEGITSGNTLRLKEKAPKQNTSLPAGDILIHVMVNQTCSNKYGMFGLNGNNLMTTLTVPIIDLITGTSITITNIDGEKIVVNIPEKTQHTSNIFIPNKGMPIFNTKNRSNLIVSITAEMPDKITNEIKDQLNKISQSIKLTNK